MLTKFGGDGIMPSGMNLGCGSTLIENSVNIDVKISKWLSHSEAFKDHWIYEGEIESPHDLPKNHFDTITATMCLEHVHLDKIPNLLYCLYEFLKPGGKLEIVVPNFQAISKKYMDSCDEENFNLSKLKLLREVTYQLLDPTLESSGNARGHQSLWTPGLAFYWLSSEGFDPVTIVSKDGWTMVITAIKPLHNPYSIGCGL